MESDFINNLNYRKNFNKFQLPEVVDKAPKILKRDIDTSPYKRVLLIIKNITLKLFFKYLFIHYLRIQ